MHAVSRMVSFASLVSLAASAAMGQCPDPRYTPGQFIVPWGGTPIYVLDTRDINGDRILDVLAARLSEENFHWTNHVLLSNGDGSFTQTHFEEASRRRFPCLGDLDLDGFPDLVVCREGIWPARPTIEVHFNDRTGHFGAPIVYQTDVNYWFLDNPSCIDLDADGLPDLVYYVNGSMRTRLNLGAGVLGDERPSTVSAGYAVPLLVDLTGDVIPEVVLTGPQGLEYRTDDAGSGDYSTSHPVSSIPVFDVTAIDVDNDGDLDLTTAEYRSDGGFYYTYLNDGGAFTAAPVLAVPLGDFREYRTYVDFDADNDPDMVVGMPSENERIIRYRNLGNGTFERLADLPAFQPWWIQVADINADGISDLAWRMSYIIVNGEQHGGLVTMLGQGDGDFEPQQFHLTQAEDAVYFNQLHMVDVTGDHAPDALMTSYFFGGGAGDGLGGLYAMTAFCRCPGDFNADAFVNSQDFFDFLAALFALQPAADVNADGVVNSQDFFDFLAAFFAGCA
ncbi:MAG: FG-GAP repeat domain-containing protein [Phycisphaerales bacterium]